MPVLALNQQQPLVGTQFVATFTGVSLEDQLLISIGGEDVVFGEQAGLPFLRMHSRTATELRVLVLTDEVPADVQGFSFQIHAAMTFERAWVLTGNGNNENFQNYETEIQAGKTLELLEFGRLGEGWFIRTKNQAIGEVPLPASQSMYPEHLRELALAARGLSAPGWSQVHAFVEVNEISLPLLPTQLYLDTLSAAQAIAASTKLAPMTVAYGNFGEVSVSVETKVDEAHRAQVKAIAAAGYSSDKPSAEQLRVRIAELAPGSVLVALVTTLGGFDVEGTLELLEARDAHLLLLAVRPVAFGIVPNLGGSQRLQGFAVANLPAPSPRSVVELLRSKK